MAKIQVDGNTVLTFQYDGYVDIYWTELSMEISAKYGHDTIYNSLIVEEILLHSFTYYCNKFRELLISENNFQFFKYVFYLHEESQKIVEKTQNGFKLPPTINKDFAAYRRILKLILEQGCDNNLNWGTYPMEAEFEAMDEKIQRLTYLGTWMYQFAEFIAYQKMIEEAHKIEFDEGGMAISWQHHYGAIYKEFFSTLSVDYEKGVFDETAVDELKKAINNCFDIDYDFAGGQIFEIKKHHNPKSPELQTIEPYVLSANLHAHKGVSIQSAEQFYNGLSLSRNNKMSLEDVVLKPYSTERYMYRPILIYTIDGVERALVGKHKFMESIFVLATNAISWNTIPPEWRTNKLMLKYMSLKGHQHDKILEDKIEAILVEKKLLYCRNIKSFKQPRKDNINIDNQLAGEIDYIIVNRKSKLILVADSKYNKTRYEAVGYRTDTTHFIKKYEPQLERKITWISLNKDILQEHLKIIYNIVDLDILNYDVQGVFFINTPTFYMFNGKYKAITLAQTADYLDGKYAYPTVSYENENGEKSIIEHPYFIKPKS